MSAKDDTTVDLSKPADRAQLATAAILFLAFSLAAVVPCLWHARNTDGDLGSHIYNAWLATGIERGEYPGLYLQRVHTNVLFDMIATRLLSWFQPVTAERLVVSLTVLIFFWGTFASVRAMSGQQAWAVTPLILILTHGWALQLGLMNLHLATGLAMFALALLWRGSAKFAILGWLLLAMAAMAQPLPPFWVALAIAYKMLYARAGQFRVWLLLAAATGAAACVAILRAGWIPNVSASTPWTWGQWRNITGADQALAYGPEYKLVAMAVLLLAGVMLLQRLQREPRFWCNSLIAHLWVLLAAGVFLVPSGLHFQGYIWDYGYITERLSLLLAVVGMAGLAATRPRARVAVAFTVIAMLFFVLLYRDTRRLNAIQLQVDEIVQHWPTAQRFVARLTDWRSHERTPYFNHMLGRACIGRCFDYGSYEAGTRQFRIRARGPNAFVLSDIRRDAVEEFREQNPTLTLYEIDWCRPASDAVCVREVWPAKSSLAPAN